MGYIYKITNKINGKVYIGLTTTSIEQRWRGHINESKKCDRHLYASMRKYGIENFVIDKIDETDNFKKLGELERYYILLNKSTDANFGYNNTFGGESNQLDGNPRARLCTYDVEKIRQLYASKTVGAHDAWFNYRDFISFSAFEKVWEGLTWKTVMPEVYSDENKNWHKKNCKKFFGEKNCNSVYSDDEVVNIRKYYVNHSLKECYDKFGKKSSNIKSFRAIIDKSYKHLPIYKKSLKKWVNPIKGENDVYRVIKENEFIVEGDLLKIIVYNDFGTNSKIFYTNKEFYENVSQYRWTVIKDTLHTKIRGHYKSFKSFIMNTCKHTKIYNIDGNKYNCTKENLKIGND